MIVLRRPSRVGGRWCVRGYGRSCNGRETAGLDHRFADGAGGAAHLARSAKPPSTFNPVVEAQNFSITQQRQAIYDTPQYQAQLLPTARRAPPQALAAEAADPGRFFTDDLCWNLGNGCAGDIRLNNWAPNGYGLVRPVLFTARDGATSPATCGRRWPGRPSGPGS